MKQTYCSSIESFETLLDCSLLYITSTVTRKPFFVTLTIYIVNQLLLMVSLGLALVTILRLWTGLTFGLIKMQIASGYLTRLSVECSVPRTDLWPVNTRPVQLITNRQWFLTLSSLVEGLK